VLSRLGVSKAGGIAKRGRKAQKGSIDGTWAHDKFGVEEEEEEEEEEDYMADEEEQPRRVSMTARGRGVGRGRGAASRGRGSAGFFAAGRGGRAAAGRGGSGRSRNGGHVPHRHGGEDNLESTETRRYSKEADAKPMRRDLPPACPW